MNTHTAIQKAIEAVEKLHGQYQSVETLEALTLLKSLPDGGDVEALARAMMHTVFHDIDVDTAPTDWTGNDVWGCDFKEMAKAAIDHLHRTGRLNTAPKAATSEETVRPYDPECSSCYLEGSSFCGHKAATSEDVDIVRSALRNPSRLDEAHEALDRISTALTTPPVPHFDGLREAYEGLQINHGYVDNLPYHYFVDSDNCDRLNNLLRAASWVLDNMGEK